MILEYNIPLQIGSRNFKARKWKVKDRDKFKKLYKNAQTQKEVENAIHEALLYPAFETCPALNNDECEYALLLLRKENVGETIKYSYMCSECRKQSTNELKIMELFETSHGTLEPIQVGDISLELQEVVEPTFYRSELERAESPILTDLICHIKSLNGDETKGFNDLKEFFEEQDLSVVDEILDRFEKMTFRITNRVKTLSCSKCNHETQFEFDQVPDLIPEKWLIR